MPGNSRTRTNYLIHLWNKNKPQNTEYCFIIIRQFSPHNPPNQHGLYVKSQLEGQVFIVVSVSVGVTVVIKVPECFMCLLLLLSFFFCSLLRGLFASHYTETHYRDDGSAVTGAHNFTVRWHWSAFDIYGEVDVRWLSAGCPVKWTLTFYFL